MMEAIQRKDSDKANYRKLCGAKTKRGTPCKNPGMENGRCRLHGGLTPRGPESKNWKHGRYSKFIPALMTQDYWAALNDSEINALQDEIALVEARLGGLLMELHAEEGKISDPERAEKLISEIEQAYIQDDTSVLGLAIEQLRDYLSAEAHAKKTWREIYGLIETRRRLADTERRRITEAQKMITAEQAGALIMALVNIIKENVSNQNERLRISRAITGLIDARIGRGDIPGSR